VSDQIDVVIVCFNRYELTCSCLRHLRAQTVGHHVIVVDNGSTDETRARLQGDWPEVQVERFEENHGFSQACNRGVAAGSGEHVVLLNNDVDCSPDFLEQLIAPLRDESVGSVAALLLQADGERVDAIGFTADVTLAAFSRHRNRSPAGADGDTSILLGPGGCAGAYRRAAWEQVEGLDETLHFYMEDVDLAVRLRMAGWRAVAQPSAVAVHLGSATLGHQRSASQRSYGGFGRGYLLRRYQLLQGRGALRTIVTEALVVCADIAISRDLIALRGRLAGWRAGAHKPSLGHPPADSLDSAISFRDSLARRWQTYGA